MKAVGYYDDSTAPGGTTRYLLDLIGALDRSRYHPVFFSPYSAEWHQNLRNLDVEIVTGSRTQDHASPISHQPVPVSSVRSSSVLVAIKERVAWYRWRTQETAQLSALFRQRPVDLLHSNNTGEKLAPIAARAAGVPRVIGTLHTEPGSDLFGEHRQTRHLRLQRQSLAALDIAIAVSEHTALAWQEHLALPSSLFRVIPNGVSTRIPARRRSMTESKAYFGLPTDALVIGSVGRLDYIKGYGDLLAALAAVFTVSPDAHFLQAGTGPLREALERDAARLGIASRVHWLGFQSEVTAVLDATDLYVQPSWCECLPFSVLDAGALGLPVMTTTVGGLPELLDDGGAGWLIPPRDPEAMARTIIPTIRNPQEMRARGNRLAARIASTYTVENMARFTFACYESSE